ncbi:YceD family protein [Corynebacterium sp. L4756]|uniref:YceD family protein n=1 Tax=unclassified Corynebacterium TaxID=2624378 RepID=UPI00374DAEA7
MNSPLKFNVAQLLRANTFEQREQTGPAPERIGLEMIAVPQGSEISVAADLTPLGEGIMVDARIEGTLEGECARCLKPLQRPFDLKVNQVFAASDDFITGDEGDQDEDIPSVIGEEIDLLQTVIDEAGMVLPFAPVCEDGCDIDTPEGVDVGVSGEEEDRVDPRWSGLEKFL